MPIANKPLLQLFIAENIVDWLRFTNTLDALQVVESRSRLPGFVLQYRIELHEKKRSIFCTRRRREYNITWVGALCSASGHVWTFSRANRVARKANTACSIFKDCIFASGLIWYGTRINSNINCDSNITLIIKSLDISQPWSWESDCEWKGRE
jgi:hypothetical protein